MNTLQLNSALSDFNQQTKKKHIVGVLAANKLPLSKIRRPSAIIANTDEGHLPGTHWIAFYLPEQGPVEYFDSYGMQPFSPHHIRFLENNKPWVFSSKELQDQFSTVCGMYSLMYLCTRMKGHTLKQFLNPFTKNSLVNDDIIALAYSKSVGDTSHVMQHGHGQSCCSKFKSCRGQHVCG